jgi:hypothetical protein
LVVLFVCDASAQHSPYLFVWAADDDRQDSDFLAVLDADPDSSTYGDVLTTIEVGFPSGAHHSEHRMPEDAQLFVNGFRSGRSYVIDLREPMQPKLVNEFTGFADFAYPHSFERLPNGNVIATFQNEQGSRDSTGGVVELTPTGEYLRSSSAAVPGMPEIRPYSLFPLPMDDVLVSTTTDMQGDVTSDSIQFWRLSDLSLSQTVRIPAGPRGNEHLLPAELRVMADGATLLLNTFNCGLYEVHDAASDDPSVRHVYSFAQPDPPDSPPSCALGVTFDKFWIQTVQMRNGLVTLDLSDPGNPTEVGFVGLGDGVRPHWIALEPNGKRIVLTGFEKMRNMVTMISVDPETGALAVDRAFGEDGSASFAGPNWPHGSTGPAVPHGSVFSIP